MKELLTEFGLLTHTLGKKVLMKFYRNNLLRSIRLNGGEDRRWFIP